MWSMTSFGDLLGPPPVLLPGDIEAEAALESGQNPAIVAAAHPAASVAWAHLAEEALDDDDQGEGGRHQHDQTHGPDLG